MHARKQLYWMSHVKWHCACGKVDTCCAVSGAPLGRRGRGRGEGVRGGGEGKEEEEEKE